MKRYLLLLFLCVAATGFGQQNTQQLDIYSAILKENRKVSVFLPDSYHKAAAVKDHYPVVYLLDGENNESYLVPMLQYLAKTPYPNVPEMIVVSVYNTNRTLHFTPTKAQKPDPRNPAEMLFADSGGASEFLEFLQQELKKEINTKFRTMPYEILAGHSFGGLFAIYCLQQHPQYFNAYIANDPSIWWDQEYLNRSFQQVDWSADPYKNKILFLNEANSGADAKSWKSDHPRAIKKFVQMMKENKMPLDFVHRYYEDEHHGSVSLPGNYAAFPYIFRGFQQDVDEVLAQPEKTITQSYEKLSARLGVKLKPTNVYLDFLEQQARKRKLPAAAESLNRMKIK